MKRLMLSIIVICSSVFASELDDQMIWRYILSAQNQESFGLQPANLCEESFGGVFIHSNPYGISALNWDFAGFKYGLGRIGFFSYMRTYGLRDLYADKSLSFGASFKIASRLSASLSFSSASEEFGNMAIYRKYDLGIRMSYKIERLSLLAIVDNINLKNQYDIDGISKPEYAGSLSYLFSDYIQVSACLKKYNSGRFRLFLEQDLIIVKNLGIHAGYINNPNVLYWGLDLSVRQFTLVMTYMSVSSLKGTLILGMNLSIK